MQRDGTELGEMHLKEADNQNCRPSDDALRSNAQQSQLALVAHITYNKTSLQEKTKV
jgi:hypothetical protein